MSNDLVPFWEKAYQEYDTITFSNKPNPTITEFEHFIDNSSRILDVGCGEGQNAIYLAQQGHYVDAFDLSEHGIAKLKHRCELSNAQVNAFAADLTTYQFEHCYDMITCFGTLHFVAKKEWKKFINNAKEYTNIGGIHIIQIFTDTVPASEDIAPFAIGLAKDEEIKELYTDWEILQFKSYVFEDEHPNVPKHLHASNKIVAKKTK
ncbi:MAG: methyltransferase domain-containing protein [Bacillus sp. (in: Bacteria)]|nr:methyltransferase domain-containing protein [Bacillus sp. (in: firmicutes)]MCM1425525.1 methyltransferase domain-containing protein [Eubacterium sp.]